MTITAWPGRPAGPLAAGALLAPGYAVLEHVCRGEELDSYEAWSIERYSRCFVKTLRPDVVHDRAAHRHLRREADILLSLCHPHIVRAYGLVETRRSPLLVCENLTGATLGHILACEGRLGLADLGNLGQQLCSALRYLHDRGYVHLDVKPSNVIASFGVTRLIDLSLARPPGPGRRGVGTLGYLSPEQITGGHFGPPADVWGLGVILHEAATGRPPLTTIGGTRHVRPPRITRRGLDPAVADVLQRCLRPEPQDRPGLGAVADAMAALSGEPDPVVVA